MTKITKFNPQNVVQYIFHHIPEFEKYWNEHSQDYKDFFDYEEGEEFKHFISSLEEYAFDMIGEKNSLELTKIFNCIEELLEYGNDDIINSAYMEFLGDLLRQTSHNQDTHQYDFYTPLLGSKAKEFAIEQDQITRNHTPGLYAKERYTIDIINYSNNDKGYFNKFDDYYHGVSEIFYPNGQVKWGRYFHLGVASGNDIFRNEEGVVICERLIVDGVLKSRKLFSNSGIIKQDVQCDIGRLVSIANYDDKGQFINEKFYVPSISYAEIISLSEVPQDIKEMLDPINYTSENYWHNLKMCRTEFQVKEQYFKRALANLKLTIDTRNYWIISMLFSLFINRLFTMKIIYKNLNIDDKKLLIESLNFINYHLDQDSIYEQKRAIIDDTKVITYYQHFAKKIQDIILALTN